MRKQVNKDLGRWQNSGTGNIAGSIEYELQRLLPRLHLSYRQQIPTEVQNTYQIYSVCTWRYNHERRDIPDDQVERSQAIPCLPPTKCDLRKESEYWSMDNPIFKCMKSRPTPVFNASMMFERLRHFRVARCRYIEQ